ncbi:hypothetical protein IFT48_00900 [Pseudomonas fluorescens]|uniref:hypothetical protein n=1 Tax=Pseudomonas TaxID=286 RepID=UPI000F02FCC7|nr:MULTISPECIES: hypothetical protein [Pseudomonas]MBD8088550.1 hypothetical protein [Pseudomonas fluorescens]MBD8614989.1 hypothetical protein [Pseudomonas putida]MBD8681328.1 hypothetical protein [Pseudomonas sp. CFBP 13719]
MSLNFQHIAPIASVLWLIALLFPPALAQAQGEVTRVIVVASKDSPELQSLVLGLRSNERLDVKQSAHLALSMCDDDATIVAFGADMAVNLTIACPSKNIVILASSYRYNFKISRPTQGSWGYFLDQPLASQVRHASMNMPSIRSLGILYSDDDVNKDEIESIAKEKWRVNIQLVKVNPGQVVAQIMRDLYQSVDAVLITGNTEIWSLADFKTYLVLGMRQGKIMIGGYNYIYMNRGSISAVHSDFFSMGADVGKQILTPSSRSGMSFYKTRKIVTNDLLAARYGIYIGNNNEW